MRNIPSVIMFIAFIYFIQAGFHWMYLILLIGGLFLLEWPSKESYELIRTSIEESKARTENIKWQTDLSRTQVKVNLGVIALQQNARRGR